MIRIEHLKKEYENATPLKDVTVEINDGDVIAVIGPSGTGKSTLLRCINLLERPTAGRVWIGADEITGKRCDINRVRQRMGIPRSGIARRGRSITVDSRPGAGVPLDVTGSGDALSLAVLKGMTEDMEYAWNEGAALPNQLKMKVKRP